MTERRKSAIAVAILLAVPTLYFLDVVFAMRTLYVRDIIRFHYPAKKALRDIILGGHFPHWNAWFEAGQPFAANPHFQVFYPLNWLILLPHYEYAFQWLPLIHLHVGALGMYLLLRSMQLSRAAAIFGAISFGVAGLSLALLNLFPLLFSFVWLPYVCLFARRFFATRSRRDFALAALFLGVQFLMGEPVTVLQSAIVLGTYAIYRGRREAAAKNLAWLAAIAVGAALVAAVQILPAIDFFGDTVRSRGIRFDITSQWSMPPARLAELVYPQFLGNGDAEGYLQHYTINLYERRSEPFFFSIYTGLLATVLALAGVTARVRGWTLFAFLFVVSIVVAIGTHTPLLHIAYDLGIGRSIRFPEKFVMMGCFALIVFAAHVLHEILGGSVRVRRHAAIVAGITTLIAAAVAVATFTPTYEPLLRAITHLPEGVDVSPLLASSRDGWLIAVARGLLLLLVIRAVATMRRPLAVAALLAFVIADLAYDSTTVAPRKPTAYFDEPAVLRGFPASRDDFRIFHLANWANRSKAAQQYRSEAPDLHELQRNGVFPMIEVAYGLRNVLQGDYDMTSLLPTEDFTHATWAFADQRPDRWLNPITAMSNIRYVGVYRKPSEALADAHGNWSDVQPVRFIEGGDAPRYYFATQLEQIRDARDFVGKLVHGNYERRVAFIASKPFAPSRGTVQDVREWPNGARLTVDAEGPAFLVMSVTPHKYWTITIDGQPVEAEIANVGYQGVPVPRGRHVVEMRYRNPLFAAGGAITIAALLVIGWACTMRRP